MTVERIYPQQRREAWRLVAYDGRTLGTVFEHWEAPWVAARWAEDGAEVTGHATKAEAMRAVAGHRIEQAQAQGDLFTEAAG